MTTKGAQEKAQGSRIAGSSLCPYEQERLKRCMANSKRLEELKIAWSASQLMDVDSAKRFKKGSKKANKQTSDVPAGAVKFRGRKRVFAQQPTVCTRSKQSKPQSNSSQTASDLPGDIGGAVISLHDKNTNMTTRSAISLNDENTNMTTGADISLHDENNNMTTGADISLHDENTNMTTGGDDIVWPDGHNHMSNEDGFVQQDDHIAMAEGADGITHPDGNHVMTNQEEEEVEWNRGRNMGHGLQRMNRARRGKLQVVITKGHQRPLVPLVAAKFATECNIIVRNHIPVFTHWKKYKNSPWFTSFCNFLQAKFEIDTEDPIVKKACLGMMKDAVRQQRHRLKKDYFDPFPLHLVSRTSPVKSMDDKQWIALVESWKSPKKMHECEMNKDNRSKVQFPQATGSQSYEVFIETKIGDKYKDEEPTALDLFKECHFSKKKGFKPAVQSAITEMENKLAAQAESEGTDRGEGRQGTEQPEFVNDVVHGVLSEKTKKNKFLQNAGIQIVQHASIEQSPQEDLAAENAELRAIINTQHAQLEELLKEVKETKESRSRDKDEMKKMQDEMIKKMQAEMDAKLELVLSQVRPR